MRALQFLSLILLLATSVNCGLNSWGSPSKNAVVAKYSCEKTATSIDSKTLVGHWALNQKIMVDPVTSVKAWVSSDDFFRNDNGSFNLADSVGGPKINSLDVTENEITVNGDATGSHKYSYQVSGDEVCNDQGSILKIKNVNGDVLELVDQKRYKKIDDATFKELSAYLVIPPAFRETENGDNVLTFKIHESGQNVVEFPAFQQGFVTCSRWNRHGLRIEAWKYKDQDLMNVGREDYALLRVPAEILDGDGSKKSANFTYEPKSQFIPFQTFIGSKGEFSNYRLDGMPKGHCSATWEVSKDRVSGDFTCRNTSGYQPPKVLGAFSVDGHFVCDTSFLEVEKP